ncbi:hypothetical protein TNCT_601231 [Trichonephila clavata]|uniref:Uncharacterized protein n=1 Tax=Trichonephila clavata TaxID=2740835 RepID=A0A8X6INK2_TRICU|nr:hypothetical protein TNCT_601231 [Trichonephila clavata]
MSSKAQRRGSDYRRKRKRFHNNQYTRKVSDKLDVDCISASAKKLCKESDLDKEVHYIYNSIMKRLNDMDSEFSLLAFLTVLFTTFSLFWDVYWIAFCKNETSGYLIFTLPAISYLALLLVLMISGFASNEQANIVKIKIQCLKHEIVDNQPKMNFIKKTLLKDNVLTLGKIYVLDKTLVIGSFGTLLTYGIVLDTLEKNN